MIIDHCRNKNELYNLYVSRPMPFQYDFEFLINNPNLFCFYDEKEGFLKGFITVQKENDKLTLSGTSIKKNMIENINAVIKICDAFNKDIYSYTPLKHAALILKKAGFIKTNNNNEYVRFKYG